MRIYTQQIALIYIGVYAVWPLSLASILANYTDWLGERFIGHLKYMSGDGDDHDGGGMHYT